jgi:hypothetical protein
VTRRKQMKSSAHDEEYFGRQQDEEDDGDQEVVQPSIKFASLNEHSLFYSDISHDEAIDYHDVEVGQETPQRTGGRWRLPDSGQRCRRELSCDQMMTLCSVTM